MKCQMCNGVGYKKISATSCAICERCGGMGEVKETNFDRITESPETLAEFIYCLVEACDYAAGNGAKKISQYANEDANDKRHIDLIHGNRDFGELLNWLNEESKE